MKISANEIKNTNITSNEELLEFVKKLDNSDSYLYELKINKFLYNQVKEFKNTYQKCYFCNKYFKPNSQKILKRAVVCCNDEICQNKRTEYYNSRNEKSIQTNLKKYGVAYNSQAISHKEKVKNAWRTKTKNEIKIIKEKVKKTCLEKYGVENTNQVLEIKEKIRNAHLSKSDDEIKKAVKKRKATNLKKYGTELPAQNQEIKNKTQKYFKEKYGSTSPFGSKEIQNKSKETLMQNYNVDNPLKSVEIQNKLKETNLEKYGVENPSQKHINNYEEYNENGFRKFIKDGYFEMQECMSHFNIEYTCAQLKKKEFNIIEPNKMDKLKTQRFIFDSINIENKILNARDIISKEIDIYLPDFKLGIEYNGLMYHSQGISEHSIFNTPNFDKNYHLSKTLECKNKGIKLFHIFEGENIDLWLSMIHNKLGLNKRIFARKCEIAILKSSQTINFLNENHIQGFVNSSINLALVYNNQLVSLMTFSKPRFTRNYDYELVRFCSLKNYNVVGGASKLFKFFLRNYNPKKIVSYANRRFSDGNLYENLGFIQIGISQPNYFYFKDGSLELYSRNKFQKHKLSKLLNYYNENENEQTNMFLNGYRRIFDCGNLVYEYIN